MIGESRRRHRRAASEAGCSSSDQPAAGVRTRICRSKSGARRGLTALETRYRRADQRHRCGGSPGRGALLLAHPPAQAAEDLVTLDAWVRRGGRLLLLADPLLEWPSERPLGDPLRAAPCSPTPDCSRTGACDSMRRAARAAERKLGGHAVLTASPGSLSGRCARQRRRAGRAMRIGKGRATIVADADLLNVDPNGGPTEHNLDALLAELASLEADSPSRRHYPQGWRSRTGNRSSRRPTEKSR